MASDIQPIEVSMWPLEETRTPNNSCRYVAECVVGGVTYSARSRRGASNELCRALVAAGVPDGPMRVQERGHKGPFTYDSFHAAAQWTYEESEKVPLHRVRWRPPPDFKAMYESGVDAENEG